jgi:hypothetical protein
MKPGIDGRLYCSFCGKSQDEVRKLIAGPHVFICDECTDLCKEIIEKERGARPPTPEPPADPAHLPDYVARMRHVIEELDAQMRYWQAKATAADALFDIEDLQTLDWVNALFDIAFPDRVGFTPDEWGWASVRAYKALGGRLDGVKWLDSYEDLRKAANIDEEPNEQG